MLATRIVCPHCGKHLKTSKPVAAGHRVLCPRCGHSFNAPADSNGEAAKPDAVVTHPRPAQPAIVAELPPVVPAAAATSESPPTPAGNRAVWIGVILGGLVLMMAVSAALVIYLATRKDPKDSSGGVASTTTGATDSPSPQDGPDGLPPPPPAPSPSGGGQRTDSPLLGDPPTLATPDPEAQPSSSLPPEEQKKVNEAIDKGVKWLQTHQTPSGQWGQGHVVGMAALPALTLLECGVPADDLRVQRAAQAVRKGLPRLGATYELALAILFLDRLGDPADEKWIRTCTLRLVAGQTPGGGWTYGCRILTPEQEQDLLTILEHDRPTSGLDLFVDGPGGSAPPGFLTQAPRPAPDKGVTGGDSLESKLLPADSTPPLDDNKLARPGAPDPQAYKKALDRLPPELRRVPALQPPKTSHKMAARDGSDNSNTHFAILGLLAAQRHRLPLDRTLALIVVRFHTSQAPDGRWDYHYARSPRAAGGSPAMTGVGLLGLALGLGLAADHAGKTDRTGHFEDPSIEKGFTALGSFIGKPLGAKKPRARGRSPINLYFLWAVERCGVLYNRREIAGKDWYAWGAELLLDAQNADGTWSTGGFPGATPVLDTSFALLFLKRANLVKDLTKKLEFFMEGKKLH